MRIYDLHSSAEALVAGLQVGNIVGNQALKWSLRCGGEDDKVLHLHIVNVGLVGNGNSGTGSSRLVTGVQVGTVNTSRGGDQTGSNDCRICDGEWLRALVLLLSVGIVALGVLPVGPWNLDDGVGLDLPNTSWWCEPAVAALRQKPAILLKVEERVVNDVVGIRKVGERALVSVL